MKWYCGLEANTMFAEGTFHLPVTRVGAATTFLREEPGYKVFIDVLPYSQCRPVIPVGGVYWDELTAARDYVIYGKKTPQKALDDETAKVQAELDRVLSQ